MGRKKSSRSLRGQDWINHWNTEPWKLSEGGTPYANIGKYNVFYMPDTNNPDVWTYCIKLRNSKLDSDEDWSDQKFHTGEEAKLAALKKLAGILGKV